MPSGTLRLLALPTIALAVLAALLLNLSLLSAPAVSGVSPQEAPLVAVRFSGNVYAGSVGDFGTPLAGVTVGLYCADTSGQTGSLLTSVASDGSGAFVLSTERTCAYLNIIASALADYTFAGARSAGGLVVAANWIRYATPVSGDTGNNSFWQQRAASTATATPAPSTPTRTATRTATRTPTRTATPTSAVLLLADLIATNIEVTQAVQDLNNSVPLVAGKRTFVRFHVRSFWGDTWGMAQLTVQYSGGTLVLYPINTGWGFLSVKNAPQRSQANHSFLFELPLNITNGALTLTAKVKTLSNVADVSPGNNQISTQVAFQTTHDVNVVIYRIGYSFQGNVYYPSMFDVWSLASWLTRAYPTAKVNWSVRTYFWGEMWRTWVVDDQGNGAWASLSPSCSSVNATLWQLWWSDLMGGKNVGVTHYYGMVDDTIAFMQGCSGVPSKVASGPTGSGSWGWDVDGSYGDWYGGHELGHSYGRKHTGFCGAKKGGAFPNPNGWISPVQAGPTAIYGFDAGSHAVYPPTWTDVMTYCANEWISDFTYKALMSWSAMGETGATGRQPASGPLVDRLLVSGAINPASGEVSLQPLYVIPSAPDVNPPVAGPYALVLRDGGAAELARYSFSPQEAEGGPGIAVDRDAAMLAINMLVPYVEGTVRLDIEDADGALLKRVLAGAQAPTVHVLSPNGGEITAADPLSVSWSGHDADGDALFYMVDYSADGGATWQTVSQPITATSLQIPRQNLTAGQQALVRVWATDGLHTALDTSDAPFTVTNALPALQIAAPGPLSEMIAGQTLALLVEAYDADDGALASEGVQWRSSLDGPLGSGAQFIAAGLSLGEHLITARAVDSAGAAAEASVRVIVRPEPAGLALTTLYLPIMVR